MSIIVETPFQNFTGLDGKPLTNGKVYIGQVGTDPTVFANQIPVFWDEAMTIPASQPLSTSAGYIVRFGTPARVWVATDYSMSVKNASGVLVYYVAKFGAVDIESEILALLGANDGASLVGSAAWYADVIIGFDATKVPDGATINFSGRTVKGDPGGGLFTYYETGTQTADNGLVYAPTGGGRLVRNGWTVFGFNGAVCPEWFGALGDRTTNDKAALQATSNAVQAFPCGGTIALGSGRAYAVGSTWSVPKLPDKAFIIEGHGAVVLNLASFDGNVFYYGKAVDTGGFPAVIKDVVFRSSTVNANAIILEWASSSKLIGCEYIGFANGVYMKNTYALIVDKCGFIGCTNSGIQSETLGHHLTVIASQFSGCNKDIYFREQAHNLSLYGVDMEAGVSCIVLDKGGTAVNINCCYIEGKTAQSFVFGMPVVGFSMDGSWFGYNALQTWTNISGGSMSNNTYWDQNQVIGSSCSDLDVGANSFNGTSVRIYSTFTAPTLINGFSNFGFGFSSAGYRKDKTGKVHLTGMVTAAVDATAFILPVAYRPSATLRFPILGDTGTGIGAVTIDTSGNVTVIRSSGRGDLSSISFYAAQ